MNDDELHASLRAFYDRDEAYFEEAGKANSQLTSERRELFKFIADGALLLDVGSGACENASFLEGRVRYIACDVSSVALTRSQKLNRPRSGAIQCESQDLPFRHGSFDLVLSTYALEHFVFPRRCLAEMWRVCKSGGRIVLISPAYDNPLELPPSVGHWPKAKRIELVAKQALRQVSRHIWSNRFFFACIDEPRVLEGEYHPDFDAVHLVSAREVRNYFRTLGGRILFERKRVMRSASNARDLLRNALLCFGIGEYAGLNLQIVVEKS